MEDGDLADGVIESELLEEYPQLTAEDIRAAIAYGAEMARYVETVRDQGSAGSGTRRCMSVVGWKGNVLRVPLEPTAGIVVFVTGPLWVVEPGRVLVHQVPEEKE